MQSTTAPAQAMSGANSSKRRKFVADGVFYAELNEFFQRELAEEGYSGVEVRVTPTVTDIIIRATHTQEVLGEQGRRIREVGIFKNYTAGTLDGLHLSHVQRPLRFHQGPLPSGCLPGTHRKSRKQRANDSRSGEKASLFRRTSFWNRYSWLGGRAMTGSLFRCRLRSVARPLAVS